MLKNEKKKIVFVIPSLGQGGAERVVSILANKFVRRDFLVNIVMIANKNCSYNIDPNINLICLNCDVDNAFNPIKRFVLRIKKIFNAIKSIKPDFVISFMSETNIDVSLAMIGMNIPLIVSERNDPATDPKSTIKKFLRRILYFRPNGFVFQTSDAQAYFSKRIQKKAILIMNPLTTQLPEPFDGIRDKRIVAVGRLNRQKNYPLMIDAFGEFCKKYDDYVLEIYGEGTLQKEIEKYILNKGLGGKVSLKGFCKDVHIKIRTASMFVMTSDFEGMPNALLEAMSLGLPCISTDCPCGGPRTLINHDVNGLLFPVGDQEALCECMSYLASDMNKLSEISANAALTRELADEKKIVEQWEKYIFHVKR